MPFPVVPPSVRNYDAGDWPVRKFNTQNGTEIRLLYGNKRYNLKLSLTYANVVDTTVSEFIAHFAETKGTFKTFNLSNAARVALLSGWAGTPGQLDMPGGVDWRYASSPDIEQIRPGISTIKINLIGVI